MSYYFIFTTNASKKSLNAITNIDPSMGVITQKYVRSHFYENTSQSWRVETQYMIKCPDMQTAFKLIKQLKSQAGWCSVRRPIKLKVPTIVKKTFTPRPFCFDNINRKALENKMTRTYDYSTSRINESTNHQSPSLLINNPNEFSDIINGDLDLLNLARELSQL